VSQCAMPLAPFPVMYGVAVVLLQLPPTAESIRVAREAERHQ
jgi:hypothetical protein